MCEFLARFPIRQRNSYETVIFHKSEKKVSLVFTVRFCIGEPPAPCYIVENSSGAIPAAIAREMHCFFVRPTVLNLRVENFTGAIPVLPAEYSDGKCKLYSKILSSRSLKNDGLLMKIFLTKCHWLRTNSEMQGQLESYASFNSDPRGYSLRPLSQ